MDKATAIEMKEHRLKAVVELSTALNRCHDKCSPDRYEAIKRAIGLSIGRINLELLDLIYWSYPELDHLNE